MANADAPPLTLDPDRTLALAYVPARARAAMAALWALDLRLAEQVRAAREPGLGAIRLAWWREALAALDQRPAPDEPLLREVAATLLPAGVTGAALAVVPEGWEPLLAPALADAGAAAAIGEARGATLFAAAARVLGAAPDARLRAGGAGWALVDAAFGVADAGFRARALAHAAPLLAEASAGRWPAALRPVGMLAMLAAADARAGTRAPGTPRRAARMAWHRLTGR